MGAGGTYRDRVIRTPRLTLRPYQLSDAEALTAGVGDFAVSKWLTRVPHPYALQDAVDYIAKVKDSPDHWIIDDGTGAIGTITCAGELGYWLKTGAWGRGFGAEAGQAVVDHWFADPAADEMTAAHFIDNHASGRVLGKLGFTPCGTTHLSSTSLSADVPAQRVVLSRATWAARRTLPDLRTPRLRLRELTAADAPEMARIGGNSNVAPMVMAATIPWPVEAAARVIAGQPWTGAPGFRLGICLADTSPDDAGALIGTIGLGPDNTLFYFLDPAHWGRGYAHEAASCLIAASFEQWDLDVIGADAFNDNPKSARLLDKLGFEKTGDAMGSSAARLEPAAISLYRLKRTNEKATR